jgi:serine/threonine protein kinase
MPTQTASLDDFLLKIEPLLESLYQSLDFACVALTRGTECILVSGEAVLCTERVESAAGIRPIIQANELIAYQGRIGAEKIKQLIDNLRGAWVIRGLPVNNVRLAEEGTSLYSWTIPAVFSIPHASRWKRAFIVSGTGPNISSLLDYPAWQEIDNGLRRGTPQYNGFDGLCGKLGLTARRNNLSSASFQISAELPARFDAVYTDSAKGSLEIRVRCLDNPTLMIEWLPQHDFQTVHWQPSGDGDLHHISVPLRSSAERAELMLSFAAIEAADTTIHEVSGKTKEESVGADKNIISDADDRWDKIRPLGEGGQGRVFLVRSPTRTAARKKAKSQIRPCIGNIGGDASESSDSVVERLAQAIGDYNRPETPNELGALKEFKIPSANEEEEQRALGRLQAEVQALKKVKHPAVLKLLAANVGERFIVTEYHDRGTLDENLDRHKGDALAALRAFRKLVDGVVEIHKQGAVHRDIKPENIFIAASDDLVLGDFGIVFFEEGQRLTKTYGERVGSHYWMAPWAYDNVRLELSQVKAPLDIYPLGKVLWSMISGQNGFPYWEYKREENDLEKLFPSDRSMSLVNGLLGRCVVREEKDCVISTAEALAAAVDELIEQVVGYRRGLRPDRAETWPCRICDKGKYLPAAARAGSGRVLMLAQISGGQVSDQQPFSIYVCDNCGHTELFKSY